MKPHEDNSFIISVSSYIITYYIVFCELIVIRKITMGLQN